MNSAKLIQERGGSSFPGVDRDSLSFPNATPNLNDTIRRSALILLHEYASTPASLSVRVNQLRELVKMTEPYNKGKE